MSYELLALRDKVLGPKEELAQALVPRPCIKDMGIGSYEFGSIQGNDVYFVADVDNEGVEIILEVAPNMYNVEKDVDFEIILNMTLEEIGVNFKFHYDSRDTFDPDYPNRKIPEVISDYVLTKHDMTIDRLNRRISCKLIWEAK